MSGRRSSKLGKTVRTTDATCRRPNASDAGPNLTLGASSSDPQPFDAGHLGRPLGAPDRRGRVSAADTDGQRVHDIPAILLGYQRLPAGGRVVRKRPFNGKSNDYRNIRIHPTSKCSTRTPVQTPPKRKCRPNAFTRSTPEARKKGDALHQAKDLVPLQDWSGPSRLAVRVLMGSREGADGFVSVSSRGFGVAAPSARLEIRPGHYSLPQIQLTPSPYWLRKPWRNRLKALKTSRVSAHLPSNLSSPSRTPLGTCRARPSPGPEDA